MIINGEEMLQNLKNNIAKEGFTPLTPEEENVWFGYFNDEYSIIGVGKRMMALKEDGNGR